ncbi:MAG: hypothetical protein WCT42_03840 [Candidatus Paceibacterota bacterium]
MDRKCEHCNKKFTISNEEMSMYEKVDIELPTLCFPCRLKRHFSFFMFGKFRKGFSDLSKETIFTVLPKNNRYPIYTLKEWHSDKWDAMNYGQDYNSSRLFFEQLKELQEKVPHPHQNGTNNIGCDWCDDVWNSKNCYLSRSMEECEDLLYSYRNLKVKNSVDAVVCFDSERCYSSLNCHNSYKLFYSRNSKDCINSYFLLDCRNCQDCFMCWNLRGKSYCIKNIQYSKDEYNKKLELFNLDSYNQIEKFRNYFEEIAQKKAVHRQNFNLKNHGSVGDVLLNTKNCYNCFTFSDSEDCFNCIRGINNISNIDANGCWYSELLGDCACCTNSYSLKHSAWSSSRFSEYLDLCIECENCFGCVGLKKKKYCILNKQYSKDEYERLKDQIITDMKKSGEYGKFLPYSMSPGPFNFSTSFLYYPETKKEDILNLDGYWEDIDESHIEGIPTTQLPDSIKEVNESICTKALVCPETGWRFNISKDELFFYKQNNIPLPRHHFDIRIKKLFKHASVLKSYLHNCCYCQKDINAYYPPEWGYKNIACEDCYQKNLN